VKAVLSTAVTKSLLLRGEPKSGKEILMRNLGGPLEDAEVSEPPLDQASPQSADTGSMRAQTLFEVVEEYPADAAEVERRVTLASSRSPTAVELTREDLSGVDLRSVVLGLGFEERTLASVQRLLDAVQPEHAVLIRYDEPGYAAEIEQMVRERTSLVEVLDYRDLGTAADALPPPGPCLVDVTGLAKPMIFQAVRRALSREGHVSVAHTQAEMHYPLDEAIEPVLAAEHNGDWIKAACSCIRRHQRFDDDLSGLVCATFSLRPYPVQYRHRCEPVFQAKCTCLGLSRMRWGYSVSCPEISGKAAGEERKSRRGR
jgi:hypothetical protein